MLVHRRATPTIKFVGTHLYTWVERGAVRVSSQEHIAMSTARARTRTARSGVERTNYEAIASLTIFQKPWYKMRAVYGHPSEGLY